MFEFFYIVKILTPLLLRSVVSGTHNLIQSMEGLMWLSGRCYTMDLLFLNFTETLNDSIVLINVISYVKFQHKSITLLQ
jgi:hypothetical protein